MEASSVTGAGRESGGPRGPAPEDAYWSLQEAAGKLNDPEGRAPFQRMPLGDALERLSRDDAAEIAPAVRRAALGALRANETRKLPDYDQLQGHYRQYVARIAEHEPADAGAPPGPAPD